MSKRFLWIIAVFMSLAMAGLIIVQSYWIGNAIDIKEKQFSQLVTNALSDISDEIRQQETVFNIIEEINPIDTNLAWERYSSVKVHVSASQYLDDFSADVPGKKSEAKIHNEEYQVYQHSTPSGDRSNITIIAKDSGRIEDRQIGRASCRERV